MHRKFSWIAFPLLGLSFLMAWGEDKPFAPRITEASNEAEQAIKKFRVPAGCRVDLFAAEPMLANPVAFCTDEKGRFYVAETFRLHDGVTDIRGHMDWLDQDLACRTVQERIVMMNQRLGKEAPKSAIAHDRVRLIEDRDGDGKADHATVFADGFHKIEDGIGAGVLARRGFVWYTCIPDLWLFRDTSGEGKADFRQSLHTGFGIHVGFLGHDMHGLRMGPDGKLYFSIGDRGANVTTEGKRLFYPDTGAVYRCNPDGTELEVFCTGLRNPQELVFDQHGNLFTCDNNSDGGDKVRWSYLVEGGDCGWRIGYQFINEPTARGPWNYERMWYPPFDGQPAFTTPPIANIGDGPSGLTYHPGVTQLPERYKEHFFLADFRGGSPNSGIRSFANKPNGASFELVDSEEFLWSILPTDVDFAPDGGLYLTDWVDGWNMPQKGRIYKVSDPNRAKDPQVLEVKKLLADGMLERPVAELSRLLEHADYRIRLEAQFALVDKVLGWRMPGVEIHPTAKSDEVIAIFADKAKRANNRLARLHAIWGLGQLGRKYPDAYQTLPALLKDTNAEVQCQAAKALGDGKVAAAFSGLMELVKTNDARVRFFGAMALGKLGRKEAIPAIIEIARDNADKDAHLRHACVMAMVALQDNAALTALAQDSSPAVRMLCLQTMRRLGRDDIARFLKDSEPKLIVEAARAINDVPIPAALPALAKMSTVVKPSDWLAYRVLNANFRLGQPENASAVANMAARDDVPASARLEGVRMLNQWSKPSGRDRVTGLWRPLEPRSESIAQHAIQPYLGGILAGPDRSRQEGIKLAARYGIKEVGPVLLDLLKDTKQTTACRCETLKALEALKDARLADGMKVALADSDPRVRAEGRRVLVKLEPTEGLKELQKALADSVIVEKQAALLALGGISGERVDGMVGEWLDKALGNQVPNELLLEVLEAARQRKSSTIQEKLARFEKIRPTDTVGKFKESLAGGDAERGYQIFRERADLSCIRCHKVKGEGGEVGPDLTGIGGKQKREYLLEAIAEPNKEIAKGFESVVLLLNDGKIVAGVLKNEDAKTIRLITPEGQNVTVARDDVDQRKAGKSPMPEDLITHLTKAELRDLVEFLFNLK